MARSSVVFAVAAAVAVGGCASLRQSVSGWFGATASPAVTPVAARQGQTYYAGAGGLTVYAEAATSSKVLGRLAPHERVIRSRVERGYAYVASDKGGLVGWVDNAQLLWRLPAAPDARPGDAAASKEAGAAPAASPGADAVAPDPTPPELAPAVAATPTSTPESAAAAPPTQAVAPTAGAVTPPAAPSMFDPY